MLLSQLGILGLLLSTLNIPVIVLFALVLIVVGIVLIRGATLIGYSPNHQRKDRNELDYKDVTYEDHRFLGLWQAVLIARLLRVSGHV